MAAEQLAQVEQAAAVTQVRQMVVTESLELSILVQAVAEPAQIQRLPYIKVAQAVQELLSLVTQLPHFHLDIMPMVEP
jgi:hypothetical protein